MASSGHMLGQPTGQPPGHHPPPTSTTNENTDVREVTQKIPPSNFDCSDSARQSWSSRNTGSSNTSSRPTSLASSSSRNSDYYEVDFCLSNPSSTVQPKNISSIPSSNAHVIIPSIPEETDNCTSKIHQNTSENSSRKSSSYRNKNNPLPNPCHSSTDLSRKSSTTIRAEKLPRNLSDHIISPNPKFDPGGRERTATTTTDQTNYNLSRQDQIRAMSRGQAFSASRTSLSSVNCTPGQIQLKQVDFCLQELVDTEEAYVLALHDIITGYKSNMLKLVERSTVLTPSDVSDVFGNINEIYAANTVLLEKFKESRIGVCSDGSNHYSATKISNIITNHAEAYHFACYKDYCVNYRNSTRCLNRLKEISPDFERLLNSVQKERYHLLHLSEFLHRPIQRVMRYPILLEAIESIVRKEGGELTPIQEALSRMKSIVHDLDDYKKEQEEAARIVQLRSRLVGWYGLELEMYGSLLFENDFLLELEELSTGNKEQSVVSPRSSMIFASSSAQHRRRVFLFEKLLLICKQLRTNSDPHHQTLTSPSSSLPSGSTHQITAQLHNTPEQHSSKQSYHQLEVKHHIMCNDLSLQTHANSPKILELGIISDRSKKFILTPADTKNPLKTKGEWERAIRKVILDSLGLDEKTREKIIQATNSSTLTKTSSQKQQSTNTPVRLRESSSRPQRRSLIFNNSNCSSSQAKDNNSSRQSSNRTRSVADINAYSQISSPITLQGSTPALHIQSKQQQQQQQHQPPTHHPIIPPHTTLFTENNQPKFNTQISQSCSSSNRNHHAAALIGSSTADHHHHQPSHPSPSPPPGDLVPNHNYNNRPGHDQEGNSTSSNNYYDNHVQQEALRAVDTLHSYHQQQAETSKKAASQSQAMNRCAQSSSSNLTARGSSRAGGGGVVARRGKSEKMTTTITSTTMTTNNNSSSSTAKTLAALLSPILKSAAKTKKSYKQNLSSNSSTKKESALHSVNRNTTSIPAGGSSQYKSVSKNGTIMVVNIDEESSIPDKLSGEIVSIKTCPQDEDLTGSQDSLPWENDINNIYNHYSPFTKTSSISSPSNTQLPKDQAATCSSSAIQTPKGSSSDTATTTTTIIPPHRHPSTASSISASSSAALSTATASSSKAAVRQLSLAPRLSNSSNNSMKRDTTTGGGGSSSRIKRSDAFKRSGNELVGSRGTLGATRSNSTKTTASNSSTIGSLQGLLPLDTDPESIETCTTYNEHDLISEHFEKLMDEQGDAISLTDDEDDSEDNTSDSLFK